MTSLACSLALETIVRWIHRHMPMPMPMGGLDSVFPFKQKLCKCFKSYDVNKHCEMSGIWMMTDVKAIVSLRFFTITKPILQKHLKKSGEW